MDTKTGAVLGFVIVSVAELLGFLLLASREGTKLSVRCPRLLALIFLLGLIALIASMVSGLLELAPMGFQYGPSAEYLAKQLHRDVESIRTECVETLPKLRQKTGTLPKERQGC